MMRYALPPMEQPLTVRLQCLKAIANALRIDVLDLDSPRFTSPQVAKAAGLDINTFRSNFRRGHFRMVGKSDQLAERHGMPNLFGMRDALGFAVAAELINAGVSPGDAWQIGMWNFAHTGSDDRDPAELFKDGLTVLLYWPATKTAKLANMRTDGIGLEFSEMFYPTGRGRTPTVIAVTLNFIVRDVMHALDTAQQIRSA